MVFLWIVVFAANEHFEGICEGNIIYSGNFLDSLNFVCGCGSPLFS